MANYHVGCGITGIFAGTLNKTSTMWVNKSDVTDEAISAVAQFLLEHEQTLVFNYRGKHYRLVVEPQESEGQGMLEDIDKKTISNAVVMLDLFTKLFCRYKNDYQRFGDLKFRCEECPFQKENGQCLVKIFKNEYAPDYRDFGSMGDL